jgi:hypothetical protein
MSQPVPHPLGPRTTAPVTTNRCPDPSQTHDSFPSLPRAFKAAAAAAICEGTQRRRRPRERRRSRGGSQAVCVLFIPPPPRAPAGSLLHRRWEQIGCEASREGSYGAALSLAEQEEEESRWCPPAPPCTPVSIPHTPHCFCWTSMVVRP